MASLRLVLGDQLSRSLSALEDLDPGADRVLMVEVHEETTYVRHHPQKIILVLSAMRHFAGELEKRDIPVDYVRLDDPDNSGSFTGEVKRAVERHSPERLVTTWPGEWRVLEAMRGWEDELGIPVEIRPDTRFLSQPEDFAAWAEGRKSLRMEYFYREMRRRTGWLMDGDEPEGGQWNYDPENRKALPKGHQPPDRQRFQVDDTTRGVIELVKERFDGHFGDPEPFEWPVTRRQALMALRAFVANALANFGDYQDAMKQDGDFLYHSLLSTSLNIGLLEPREVAEATIEAYRAGDAPLAAVEGFVRQVLGWREYVRGLYWLKMPDYADGNFLRAQRKLPEFYWSGDTEMNCLRQAIGNTRRHAYAHHIQRLMVTGTFALLAGIRPKEVEEWYLIVYADAFEWVELPNVHGMALFADGGLLASKPYAASGSYIDRMSDYCSNCRYRVKDKTGPDACPFNYLYWDFLIRHEERLRGNPRLGMPYRNLDRMSVERKEQIVTDAERFLDSL